MSPISARHRLAFGLAAWALPACLISAPSLAAAHSQSKSAADATPAGLPFSGRVFTDIYFPASELQTSGYRQNSASFWLQADPHLGEYGSARVIFETDATQASTASALGAPATQFKVGVREAYLSYARNGWEVRAGQQIIPWGKSDVVNPTDFLTAKDYAFFNPDDEVRRTGAVSLMLNWTPQQGNSPLTLTAVVTPIFAQSRLLIPPNAVPAGITLSPSVALPPQTLGNTETAFKASYAASRWDASVSFFRGFNHVPEFALLSSTSPTSFTVGQTFHPIRAVGGDLSFTLDKWIVRGESAYVWTANDSGTNPLIQPSHWDLVAGVERPINNDFRLQAQFVYRVYPLWSAAYQATGPDPVTTQVNQGIAAANALLLGYQDTYRPGATARLSYSNESSGVEAEVFALVNFVGGDFFAQPKVSYHWTDALTTTAGIALYGGPEDRPLGAEHVYDSVFFEGKYTF